MGRMLLGYNFLSLILFVASLCFGEQCSNSTVFRCGKIQYIEFPFWGGSLSDECGLPEFHLDCNDGKNTTINISSQTYRVQEISFASKSILVARDDLWQNACPLILRNTTNLDASFTIRDDNQNVTLFFNCSSDVPHLTNLFDCNNRTNSFNFFTVHNNESSDLTCDATISVPLKEDGAQSLIGKISWTMSSTILQEVLRRGFWLKWKNPIQTTPAPSWPGDHPPEEAPAPAPVVAPSPSLPPKNGHQWSSMLWIIAGAVAGVIAFILLSIIVYSCYLKKQKSPTLPNSTTTNNVEKFLDQHQSLAPQRYRYSDIKKYTKSFTNLLGKGGYGSVYKGTLPDGRLVAVKVLVDMNKRNGDDFINEVASIGRTSHLNIVKLLGFCYDRNECILVYEYMPNKSLDYFISRKDGSPNLEVEKLLDIAIGVAKGLDYLHTGCNPRIIHFDIKPQNILLDEEFCPKICDFGMAEVCKMKQSILSGAEARGTMGYIAPELYSRTYGGVSNKCDVYSYGMMVLRMSERGGSSDDTVASQSCEDSFVNKFYNRVKLTGSKMRLDEIEEIGEEILRKLNLVGLWCIQTRPSDRPSMRRVVEMLEGSIHQIPFPPKPLLFDQSSSPSFT